MERGAGRCKKPCTDLGRPNSRVTKWHLVTRLLGLPLQEGQKAGPSPRVWGELVEHQAALHL